MRARVVVDKGQIAAVSADGRTFYMGKCSICGLSSDQREVHRHIRRKHLLADGIQTLENAWGHTRGEGEQVPQPDGDTIAPDLTIEGPTDEEVICQEVGRLMAVECLVGADYSFIEARVEGRWALNMMRKPHIRAFFSVHMRVPVRMDAASARANTLRHADFLIANHLRMMRRNRYVSLMVDGVTRNGRKFFAIVAWDGRRLRLFDVPVMDGEDHVAIARCVARVARMIAAVGARVIAIVSDNAAPNVRGFDPNAKSGTAQIMAGVPILFIRCGVHSIHLALGDLTKAIPEFGALLHCLSQIFAFLRHRIVKKFIRSLGATGKIPVIEEIKWLSYYEAFDFTAQNEGYIEQALADARRLGVRCPECCEECRLPMSFRDFRPVVKAFGEFIKSVQGDATNLATFFSRYLRLLAALDAIEADCLTAAQTGAGCEQNPAATLRDLARARARGTFDIVVAELAYVITANGLVWWRARVARVPVDPASEEDFARAGAVDHERFAMVARLVSVVRYMELGANAEDDAISRVFTDFLESGMPTISGREDPSPLATREWWMQWGRAANPAVRAVAHAAVLLGEIPVSEAPCERVGSLIERMFDPERCRSGDDIIEAEIIIRADQVYREL